MGWLDGFGSGDSGDGGYGTPTGGIPTGSQLLGGALSEAGAAAARSGSPILGFLLGYAGTVLGGGGFGDQLDQDPFTGTFYGDPFTTGAYNPVTGGIDPFTTELYVNGFLQGSGGVVTTAGETSSDVQVAFAGTAPQDDPRLASNDTNTPGEFRYVAGEFVWVPTPVLSDAPSLNLGLGQPLPSPPVSQPPTATVQPTPAVASPTESPVASDYNPAADRGDVLNVYVPPPPPNYETWLTAGPSAPPITSSPPTLTPPPNAATPSPPFIPQTTAAPRDFWSTWFGDATQTEWAIPAPDRRLIQPITHYDTGNRALNYVLNKMLFPWRNLLGSVENIFPYGAIFALSDLDERLRQDPDWGLTYQAATTDIAPLEGALGEIGPALDWLSTNLTTGRYSPLWWFMGSGGVGGGGGLASQALGPEVQNALVNLADSAPTGPSFEGIIDLSEFENDPVIIDRLSRARAFDLGEYQSLTGRGPYGRVGDALDSDEALQNAYIRLTQGGARVSDFTRANPAIALPPQLHGTIQNLRGPTLQGLTPEQVLQFHLDQLERFTPEYIVRTLGRESQRFIDQTFYGLE
jgi:hypothetical protein